MREAYGDERPVAVGMVQNAILYVVFTDGTLHQVLADGSEQVMPQPPPMRAMTEEEISEAAVEDSDAQPLTEERMAGMRRVPRAKTLRRALGLMQEEFAAPTSVKTDT